jgi:uncharacterized SAM-binding protein YcdF (DUF218 family)
VLFVLSKIVAAVLYPVGLAFFLLVAGIGLARLARGDRPRAWGWRLIGTGLAIFYVFSNGFVASALTRSLERQVLGPRPLPRADGVIVLGGGIQSRAWPRQTAEVSEAGDRLLYGAHLVREGHADWLVCAAGQGELAATEQTEAEAMQEMLSWMGVRPDQILLDRASRTTYENAIEALRLVREHGGRSIHLVTSASHMPRSLAVFRKQARVLGLEALEIIPAPCDFAVIDPEKRPPWYYRAALTVLPSADALAQSTRMIHEYYGLLAYRLRGWL